MLMGSSHGDCRLPVTSCDYNTVNGKAIKQPGYKKLEFRKNNILPANSPSAKSPPANSWPVNIPPANTSELGLDTKYYCFQIVT